MKKHQLLKYFLWVIFCFALKTPVSAALPPNELWREDLINNVVGFGRNTIGGKGGTLCQVTNLNDSGPGSLRVCAEAVEPMWITFTVSGTITLQSVIHIKSYKTIDGRGQNIVIANKGITIGTWDTVTGPISHVIIHNISMKNITSNGMIIVAENASNVWIDHCTFQNAADEILYVGSGSPLVSNHIAPYGVTISWNHFLYPTDDEKWEWKAILVSDPSATMDAATTITIHHNHYQTNVRHPLMRWAKVHSFNNYYHLGQRSGTNTIGAQIRTHGQFYSENEILDAQHTDGYPVIKVDQYPAFGDSLPDNVKVVNAWLINGAKVEQLNSSTIFVPSSYYSYKPETANAVLQTAIINGAGRQNVTIPTSPAAPINLSVR